MNDNEYTLTRSLVEGVAGSIFLTPFILGFYVIISTVLGYVPTTYEYFIVCAITTSAVFTICLLAYAANRPDKQVELINHQNSQNDRQRQIYENR